MLWRRFIPIPGLISPASPSSSHVTSTHVITNHTLRDDSWGTGVSQARAAIDSMMSGFYNGDKAMWQPEIAWWLSGNALQTLLDFMYATNEVGYLPHVVHIIDEQIKPLKWWPEGEGYFRADSTDDTGWWALAMVRMYDLTKNETYLDIAKMDEAYMSSYWSYDTCGGGIIWDIKSLSYKNAISNELYFALAAAIHNRIPKDEYYLPRALEAWNWFNGTGLINPQGLVNDGLRHEDCKNNGQPVWTYNQGVILGGLIELFTATGNLIYIRRAIEMADAVLASSLVVDGVLVEQCEAEGWSCDTNQQAFKGIFARYLGQLNKMIEGHPYKPQLRAWAKSVWDLDRNGTYFFDVRWKGPVVAKDVTIATQASAASLFIAALE